MEQVEVGIWFADESGFEGDPRPRKRWDKKASKTRVNKNGGHLRMNLIGMVCPRSGQFFAIEASHSDSATFQAFNEEQLLSFRPSYLRRYESPKKDSKNCLYRNVMMTNALSTKEPDVCQHNGGYQKVNLPPQSTTDLKKTFDQAHFIRF